MAGGSKKTGALVLLGVLTVQIDLRVLTMT